MNGGLGQFGRVLKSVSDNDPVFRTREDLVSWARGRARQAETGTVIQQLLTLQDIRRVTAAHAHLVDHHAAAASAATAQQGDAS